MTNSSLDPAAFGLDPNWYQQPAQAFDGASLRWGILGAAKFALEHMGPAIHLARGNGLVALATSSKEKAHPFEARVPGLRVHGSYEALLADPEIDAVYIPLPNHLHAHWTLEAIKAGKHVLVEKPLGLKAADFDPVIKARDASGLLVAEAYMIVHHPQWQLARAVVQSGVLGRLRHVDVQFTYNNATDTDNIRNRPETGGGGLPDIGVYTFGAVRFATGAEPAAIRSSHIDFENDVDVFAQVTADFPGFTYGAVVSMRAHPRQQAVFHGEAGHLTLTAPFNAGVYDQAEVTLETNVGRSTHRFPGVNQYVLQVENFALSARKGLAYPCPLEFSRGTQAMIDAVFDRASQS